MFTPCIRRLIAALANLTSASFSPATSASDPNAAPSALHYTYKLLAILLQISATTSSIYGRAVLQSSQLVGNILASLEKSSTDPTTLTSVAKCIFYLTDPVIHLPSDVATPQVSCTKHEGPKW